nr:pyruvate:ferredoxin (flavodoxin) oxidoreductase [Candidatus Omnitrophota bacterium]
FGLGMRVSLDKQREYASELLGKFSDSLGDPMVSEILNATQKSEADIYEQRQRVEILKRRLMEVQTPEAERLLKLADLFVKKSVWIVGGDGWAYDIGFGGLDHVLATGRNVKVLVLDTEVYSNTGGQMSKSTPLAAVAKFAANGKNTGKKDLGLMAMTYGHIYVAKIAMGANDEHTLKAFLEADAYDGPALIIAYSHCVAHGINMTTAMQNQKAAVHSGQWPLYRFHPEKAAAGKSPFTLDSRAPTIALEQYLMMENRFRMLTKSDPDKAKKLFASAAENVSLRRKLYEYLAQGVPTGPEEIRKGGERDGSVR